MTQQKTLQPHQDKTLVLKFGGAAVATTAAFSRIADIIIARRREYPRIVAVVSAMGDMTNELDRLAREVHPEPPRREYDMLVSVGERISCSLLAMALARKEVEAVSFTGSQSGIITCDQHSDARILEVRPYRLLPELAMHRVVIVAGFQGVSEDKEITTLGRGGSDTSAVALAAALSAEKVEFYKDVDGVFTSDPHRDSEARQLLDVDHETVLKLLSEDPQVLHPRAVRLAQEKGLTLHVRPFGDLDAPGTVIGGSRALASR